MLNYPVHFSGIGELREAPGSIMCCKYICRVYGCCWEERRLPQNWVLLAQLELGSISQYRAATQSQKRVARVLRCSFTSFWKPCYGPVTVQLKWGCGKHIVTTALATEDTMSDESEFEPLTRWY